MTNFQEAAPPTLPLMPPQPVPVSTQVLREEQADGPSTTISRVFLPQDVRNCRLCPLGMCGANEYGHCLTKVPYRVPDELAPTFPLFGDDRTIAMLMARRNRVADGR